MPEDFKDLRRLLTLKRHEQPPPGYFNRLSAQITERLQAGVPEDETLVDRLHEEAPWLGRLVEKLIREPLWSGGLAAAACAVAIAGWAFIRDLDFKPLAQVESLQPALEMRPEQAASVFTDISIQPQPAAATNGSVQPTAPGSLFNLPLDDTMRVKGRPGELLPPR